MCPMLHPQLLIPAAHRSGFDLCIRLTSIWGLIQCVCESTSLTRTTSAFAPLSVAGGSVAYTAINTKAGMTSPPRSRYNHAVQGWANDSNNVRRKQHHGVRLIRWGWWDGWLKVGPSDWQRAALVSLSDRSRVCAPQRSQSLQAPVSLSRSESIKAKKTGRSCFVDTFSNRQEFSRGPHPVTLRVANESG